MSERVAVPTGPTQRQPTVPQIKAALRRLQTSVDRIDVEAVAAAARSRAEKAVREIQAKVDLLTGQVDAAAASTAKTATAAERSRRYRPRRKGVGSIDTLGALECEIARNSDPLRAVFASNRDPSALCVSVSPYGPGRPGRGLGDDVRGRDRRYPARLFRAAPAD